MVAASKTNKRTVFLLDVFAVNHIADTVAVRDDQVHLPPDEEL